MIQIHQAVVLIDIDEYRSGVAQTDGLGRRDEGIRGNQNLVAPRDADTLQSNEQGIRTIADPDAVRRTAKSRKSVLEIADVLPKDEFLIGQDVLKGVFDVVADDFILLLEIHERYFHL